ncbi:MAG: long-chain fatty acid--CoA ligase [Sphingobacteriales bacterium]|nr:long-chain fatty acid--CoA ligase [Sphingobacteriales bacterium]
MKAMRLFDYLLQQKNLKPTAAFLSYKDVRDNKWKSYTYQETYERVLKAAQLLLDAGIQPNDKVALISANCPEWNFADLAIQMIGGVCVPMYPTISKHDYEFIFKDAEIKIAFVSNETIYKKIEAVRIQLPLLQKIISFDVIKNTEHFTTSLSNINANEQQINSLSENVNEQDLATIIYTSGTTGNPKGVVLSHYNIISNLNSIQQDLPLLEGKKALSFLPLCHSFERTVFYAYLANGIHICYAENLEKIADNLKEIQPYCFTTVPRLLEKVFDKIIDKSQQLDAVKKKLFDWALQIGMEYEYGKEKKDILYALQLFVARKLVFSKWKEALGGNIEFIVTGAAPIQPRLIRIFTAAGIDVLEGYGLTETSPVLAFNRMNIEDRKIGTVGLPVRGVSIKIADDGEILAKGPNIMKGYYHQQALTDEVIDKEVWFHTGDIGELTDNKFLKITDRKKELFKTSGGKYIAPQAIENKMKESKYIEQIMVVGEYQKYISALIVPCFSYLHEFAKVHSISFTSNKELIEHPAIIQLIESEIKKLNTNFGQWEQIKKFTLLPAEWTSESGELTPTMKVKRKIISERYRKQIEEMYT